MKAEFEAGGQTVEVDFTEMEKRLLEKLSGETRTRMESYFKEARLNDVKTESTSKGVVEKFSDEEQSAKKAVVEEFRKGDGLNAGKIKEQWTIAVPRYATKEISPHFRDYLWVTDAVKGKAGETVNIPVVYDIDFEHVTAKTGTFTVKTNLINVYTTTLHESGAYYDAYYGDIEKIDANLLEELNRVFAHAAVRAEDYDVCGLLTTASSGQVNSKGGNTQTAPMYVGSSDDSFASDLVVDALVALMQRGKDVHPSECVLVVNPTLYGALLKEVVGSTPLSTARPDTIQRGLIEDFLGVKILVTSNSLCSHSFSSFAGSSYDCGFLLRPKRAIALAPKRDILIETDKLIATRQLRIAASHTYGLCFLDATEIVPIVSSTSPALETANYDYD